MRQQQALLGETERDALQLYNLLASRVIHDLRLTQLVFDVAGVSCTKAQALALLEMLDLIHATKCPLPAETKPDDT